MKKRNLVIRIIAVLLCALMLLGIVTVVLSARALGPDVPETGSNNKMLLLLIPVLLGIAVAAACIISSQKSKNDNPEDKSDENTQDRQ